MSDARSVGAASRTKPSSSTMLRSPDQADHIRACPQSPSPDELPRVLTARSVVSATGPADYASTLRSRQACTAGACRSSTTYARISASGKNSRLAAVGVIEVRSLLKLEEARASPTTFRARSITARPRCADLVCNVRRWRRNTSCRATSERLLREQSTSRAASKNAVASQQASLPASPRIRRASHFSSFEGDMSSWHQRRSGAAVSAPLGEVALDRSEPLLHLVQRRFHDQPVRTNRHVKGVPTVSGSPAATLAGTYCVRRGWLGLARV